VVSYRTIVTAVMVIPFLIVGWIVAVASYHR
jgi:hypothetical protein